MAARGHFVDSEDLTDLAPAELRCDAVVCFVVYPDIVVGALDVARKIFEDLMRSSQYEYQSEFYRKPFREGVESGVTKGQAQSLLAVLEAREIAWSAADEARIAEADPETLTTWIRRAATADEIREVFRD